MTDKSKDYSGAAWDELRPAVIKDEHVARAWELYKSPEGGWIWNATTRQVLAELCAREDELRAALKRIEELEAAGKNLSFMAQTSGGWETNERLIAAIDAFSVLLPPETEQVDEPCGSASESDFYDDELEKQ